MYTNPLTVDKAVEYILAQPDGEYFSFDRES